MNVVTLIGDLATDVELRELADDKRVARFLVAIDRPGGAGGADFVRVSAWNKQAEVCSRFLAKGKRVAVDGRLRSRSWEDADGKRRSAVEVVASSVQFLSARDEAPGGQETPFAGATARS
ncbi:MAG: single-stranded DNA-binding protein [Actinobacteria bacterium]|nr:single-stranded DNA-binding protein [Actinomycetota bacterium]